MQTDLTRERYSHLSFDIFFQKLFIHSVHLDLAAVVVVINHVGTELWGDLNRTVRRLGVSETLRVFVITCKGRKSSFKKKSTLYPKTSKTKKEKKKTTYLVHDLSHAHDLSLSLEVLLGLHPPPGGWRYRLQSHDSLVSNLKYETFKSDPRFQAHVNHFIANLVPRESHSFRSSCQILVHINRFWILFCLGWLVSAFNQQTTSVESQDRWGNTSGIEQRALTPAAIMRPVTMECVVGRRGVDWVTARLCVRLVTAIPRRFFQRQRNPLTFVT